MLGPILLTWHNIQYYQDIMSGLRLAISTGTLQNFMTGVRTKPTYGRHCPHFDGGSVTWEKLPPYTTWEKRVSIPST